MELHTIKITPEDVEGHIKAAIMGSAIGEALTKGIKEKLSGWQFDQAVKTVLEQEIPKIIRSVLQEPAHAAMVKNAVREALTEPLVQEIAARSVQQIWK